MKRRLSPQPRRRLLALAISCCFAGGAWALPTDPVVVNGTASFAQTGNVLTVTNSNGAIIHWQSFNIGAGETTHFLQPSASSSVLNHVLANNPSALYGTLSSNGQVWLINPAGIVVGPGAVIDTAGFVASTLAVRAEDFLAGKLHFQATPGAGEVVNRGEIRTPSGGFAYLVGANVTNEGLIRTPNGETLLAAGQTVSLIDTATPGVKVEISGAANNATNLGQIVAEAGRIGIAGSLVKNGGALDASSVVSEGGRIFLKASQDTYVDGNGRIVATGTQGGQIEVLGHRVAVTDNAEIDASGANGGGTVLVGGDYLGGNPEVPNAWISYFGPNATLKANATDNGDGGKVIVWADDTTRAYGRIEAKGGPDGGDGGFVETSGKRYLDVNGIRVNTGGGTWLLDPTDIQIVAGSGVTGGTGMFDPGADTATIGWDTIESNLANTSVTIDSNSNYGGQGNIEFSAGKTYDSNYSLSFNAAKNIIGNGVSIINTGTGDISFTANGSGPGAGIFFNSGSQIKTGGNVTMMANNGSIGVSYIEAQDVSLTAKHSIRDQNSGTPDALNIVSNNGVITLQSTHGADPLSTCSPKPCIAISADIGGSPNQITATVSNGSTYGGIDIRYFGATQPGSIQLYDGSTTANRNSVEFETTGSLLLNGNDLFGFTGNEIHLYAAGGLTLNATGAGFAPGTGSSIRKLTLASEGSVTVKQDLSADRIGIVAGLSEAVLDTLPEDFDGAVDQIYAGHYTPAGNANVTVLSNLNAQSTLGVAGYDIQLGDTSFNGSLTSQTGDVKLFAARHITLNGNSYIRAGDDAYLKLAGATSKLQINPPTGPGDAYILADSPSTIYLEFPNRSSGGVFIDGAETTTSTPNGSGFFVTDHGTPAVAGSTLLISYGVASEPASEPIVAALTNEIINSTQLPDADVGAPPPLPPSPPTDATQGMSAELAAGGEPGTFGASSEEEEKREEGQPSSSSAPPADDARNKPVSRCT